MSRMKYPLSDLQALQIQTLFPVTRKIIKTISLNFDVQYLSYLCTARLFDTFCRTKKHREMFGYPWTVTPA